MVLDSGWMLNSIICGPVRHRGGKTQTQERGQQSLALGHKQAWAPGAVRGGKGFSVRAPLRVRPAETLVLEFVVPELQENKFSCL